MSYSFGGISFICSRGDYMSIYIYNLKKKKIYRKWKLFRWCGHMGYLYLVVTTKFECLIQRYYFI